MKKGFTLFATMLVSMSLLADTAIISRQLGENGMEATAVKSITGSANPAAFLSVAEAIAAVDGGEIQDGDSLSVYGIVTKIEFKGKNFAKYGSSSIYVRDANGEEGEFEFYNCLSFDADTFRTSDPEYDATSTKTESFESVTDSKGFTVKVGDLVCAQGRFFKYNERYELNTGCFLIGYTQVTAICDENQGSVVGAGPYKMNSSCTLEAKPNYGYHFTQWSDGITDNPRTIVVTQDTTFTAEFAKNPIITYVYDRNQGYIEGNTTLAYDTVGEVTFTAIPNYGYHFVQWSDGVTDNPRTIVLTQDTTFAAVFAPNEYTLTVVSDSPEIGTVEGSGVYTYDSYQNISATATKYGYSFDYWQMKNTPHDAITVAQALEIAFAAGHGIIQGHHKIYGYIAERYSSNEYYIGDAPGSSSILCLRTYTYLQEGDRVVFDVDYLNNQSDIIGRVYAVGENVKRLQEYIQYTDNPFNFHVTGNDAITAYFRPNMYEVSLITSLMGTVSGYGSYSYLSDVQISATPNFGYHFVQWSDGVIDNPRTFVLTHDTTFTAEFAADTSGQCGENLVWAITDNVLSIIGSGAMWDDQPWVASRESIKQINLPQGLTYIGNYAFEGFTALTALTIPSSVESVGRQPFYNCKNITSFEGPLVAYEQVYTGKLKTVVINGGNTDDLSSYFWQSASLVHLDLTAVETTTFPQYLLNGFINIEELVLPAHLENIGYMSVAECMELKEIAIPASVVEIEKRAFEDCRSLAKIEFVNESQLQTIGDWAFYNCHELAQLEIPEGVTEIGKAAFYGCTYLKEVKLPASVQALGDNAFALCAKMQRMDVDALLPPTIEAKTFEDVSRQMPVYVPDESVSLYKSDPLWKELNIVGRHESPTGVEEVTGDGLQVTGRKILRNGQILILRGEKVYTVTGQEVR